jgi:hypothetical protein
MQERRQYLGQTTTVCTASHNAVVNYTRTTLPTNYQCHSRNHDQSVCSLIRYLGRSKRKDQQVLSSRSLYTLYLEVFIQYMLNFSSNDSKTHQSQRGCTLPTQEFESLTRRFYRSLNYVKGIIYTLSTISQQASASSYEDMHKEYICSQQNDIHETSSKNATQQ